MTPPPKYVEPPRIETLLLVDAMYLHAARASFQRALEQEAAIDKARKRIGLLHTRRDRIVAKHGGDSMAGYDQLEPIYIQMEGADYQLGEACGPQLHALASVHILAAAAPESHINAFATATLAGSVLQLAERFSLEAKWFTLPRLAGLPGFETGEEPYQGFARLVRLRNSLVHYKQRSEPWEAPGVPAFLEDLGLTREAADRSLEAAVGMVARLAKQRGLSEPYWLERQDISYFEVTVGR
jgi:hypothetical protein